MGTVISNAALTLLMLFSIPTRIVLGVSLFSRHLPRREKFCHGLA